MTGSYRRFADPVAITITINSQERAGFAVGWLGNRVDVQWSTGVCENLLDTFDADQVKRRTVPARVQAARDR